MKDNWAQDGALGFARAESPNRFVRQHVAPLFYHPTLPARGKTQEFATEEDFWRKSDSITFASVRLDAFRLSDWFPRTPGVYWSPRGQFTRESAESLPATNDPELGLIYTPRTKRSLIEDGGIGTIRLRPRRIDGTDCWLATAVKGPQCAGGVPLALPHAFLVEGKLAWGDTAIIHGTVRFLQDAGLEDVSAYVHHASPVIIFVEKLETLPTRRQSKTPIILTPVALFDPLSNKSKVRAGWGSDFGYTFVQSTNDFNDDLQGVADWIEKYAAKHGGRIVTNFDERSPILSNAPLSYQRLISKTYDRQIITHLHLEKLAERIDLAVTTEYNNYGQVGAMGNHARSDENAFLEGPSVTSGPGRRPKKTRRP